VSVATISRAIEATHTEVDRRKGLVRAIVNDDSLDRFNTVILSTSQIHGSSGRLM
jgi:hypothetical protein